MYMSDQSVYGMSNIFTINNKGQPDGFPVVLEAETFRGNDNLTSQGKTITVESPVLEHDIYPSRAGWVEVETIARKNSGLAVKIEVELSPQTRPQEITSSSFQSYYCQHKVIAASTTIKVKLASESIMPGNVVEIDKVIVRYIDDPQLTLPDNVLQFSSTKHQVILTPTNSGLNALEFSIAEYPDISWLTIISPMAASLAPGQSQQVVVSIDTTGLDDGSYSTNLRVVYNQIQELYITAKLSKVSLEEGEQLVFSDDFSDGLGNWIIEGEVAEIENGRLKLSNFYGTVSTLLNPTEKISLYNMSVSLYIDNGPEARANNGTEIYLRYVDNSNYVRLWIAEDTVYDGERQCIAMDKSVNGQHTELVRLNQTLLAPGYYKFSAIDDTLLFENGSGAEMIRVVSPDNYLPGGVMFQVNEETTWIDDVEVYQYGDKTDSGDDGSDNLEPSLFAVMPSVLDFDSTLTELNLYIECDKPWTISNNSNWFICSKLSGESSDTVMVTVDRSQLDEGNYNANLAITSNNVLKNIAVKVTKKGAPIFYISCEEIDFHTYEDGIGCYMQNKGTGVLTWEAQVDSLGSQWLTCEPSSGSLEGGKGLTIAFWADRTKIEPGSYSANILFKSNDSIGNNSTVAAKIDVINNVAFNRNVRNSSKYSRNYAGSKTTDGNRATMWKSKGNRFEWIYVVLNTYYDIDKVVVDWAYDRTASYAIQTWNGWRWITQARIDDRDYGERIIAFPKTVKTRYVAVVCYNTSGENYAIREFKVSGVAGGLAKGGLGNNPRDPSEFDEYISAIIPESFSLLQNHPNPFNPVTTISYDLPTDCHVTLEIYNMLGQRVATLVDEHNPAGSYAIKWYANELAGGVYFYQIQAGEFTQIQKMLLIK